MDPIPVIVVFDVGKTNKKLLLIDEQYKVVFETSDQLTETIDEDTFPCEDVQLLTRWVKKKFAAVQADTRYLLRAVNFSAHGASFVCLDEQGKVILPLYNYLKPYPAHLQEWFYQRYGGRELLCRQTASPALGSLNSGLQLLRLRYEKPDAFNLVSHALHLPQYISHILSGIYCADITSIGCHTHLWDFERNDYHDWVRQERIIGKFPSVKSCTNAVAQIEQGISIGTGLHDSSAALIPYLSAFREPFVLLSTGTWCISLNPFNHQPLTDEELQSDCLCFLSYDGRQVKASRLFAGYEHEQQVKLLAAHFNKSPDFYKHIDYNPELISALRQKCREAQPAESPLRVEAFRVTHRSLDDFESYDEAYHQLIMDLVDQQIVSTGLVLKGSSARRIFVDGGFSKNAVYMQLMAEAFPTLEVYAASVPQASALGAALALHDQWNNQPRPADIIGIKRYDSATAGQAG